MSDLFRNQIRPQRAQPVFDFWTAAHGPQGLPKQSDLDLMSIPELVPNCFILDVVEKTRFRYRFVGTAIEAHIGKSLTGHMMDEIRDGNLLKTLTELFTTTQKTGEAGFATTQMPTETREHLLYHRLSLPLSDNGKTVDKIFGCHFFELADQSSAHPPYVEMSGDDEVDRVTMVFDRR